MPLDIHVDADVSGLRDAARFMRQLSGHTHNAGTEVHGVKADSAQDWGGDSGHGFRGLMGRFGTSTDDMRDGGKRVADGLEQHADAMQHVKQRMQQARQVAAGAGLRTSEKQIFEPGPAPPSPGKLPDKPTPQQSQAHTAATQAAGAHQAQVRAYQEATQTVGDARNSQRQSDSYLNTLIGSDKVKKGLKVGNATAALAGSAIGTTNKYRKAATRMRTNAAEWNKVRLNPASSLDEQVEAFTQRSISKAKATTYTQRATGTLPRRALDKLPKGGKAMLGNVGDIREVGGTIGKFANPILKRIPVAGTVFTAAGIAYDVHNGADWKKATISGASSLAAGTAVGELVGTACGGPVGFVAGAAVGAGVGWTIDHWDEVQDFAGDATDWVGDRFSDVGSAISSIF